MPHPLISVILSTYNGSQYLSEAIMSVLFQDYQNLELIIIDDASLDIRVGEIIAEFKNKDHRIRSYRNEKNQERSWSKNFGVQQAKGDYIAFIDDDDIWKRDKLKKQIICIENNKNLAIIGTYANFINESGSLISATSHLKIDSYNIRNNILLTNQFIHSSVLIRKKIFEKVGGFSLTMSLCEDYDLWLRILSISEGANIPESLIDYRVRTSSTTARNMYRMKFITIGLIWKYRLLFPSFVKAFIVKILILPYNTKALLKIWNLISLR